MCTVRLVLLEFVSPTSLDVTKAAIIGIVVIKPSR